MSTVSIQARKRGQWQRAQAATWTQRGQTAPTLQYPSTATIAHPPPTNDRSGTKSWPRFHGPHLPVENSTGLVGCGFTPFRPQIRSFEELHSERSYLLDSLQRENLKATEFLRNLRPLEETLVHSRISYVRRRAKKQLIWLRRRLHETIRQEKNILARLGHLSFEIQSGERTRQIENERWEHEQLLSGQLALCQGMQQIQLGATSEVPAQGHAFPNMQWSQQPQYQPGHYDWQPPPVHAYASEMPNQNFNIEFSPASSEHMCSNHLEKENLAETRPSLAHRPASMNNADVGILATNTACVAVSNVKRHSWAGVSGIQKIWSDYTEKEQQIEANDESGPSAHYLGFYVKE